MKGQLTNLLTVGLLISLSSCEKKHDEQSTVGRSAREEKSGRSHSVGSDQAVSLHGAHVDRGLTQGAPQTAASVSGHLGDYLEGNSNADRASVLGDLARQAGAKGDIRFFRDSEIPQEYNNSSMIAPVVGISLANNFRPEAAISMIKSYPDALQDQIERSYWSQLSAVNLNAAKEVHERDIVPEKAQVSVAQHVATDILKHDSYDAALHFATQLDNPATRNLAVEHVFDVWVEFDSVAASKKAATLPPGPIFDSAAEAISNRLFMLGDKDGANTWRESKAKR